jgi:sugar lactone lactonase YvrE
MTDFAPRPWQPPPAPGFAGDFARNDRLANARIVELGAAGPEDVVIADDGMAYAGTEDGWILAIDRKGAVERHAETGGRPLGLELHGEDLLVCNANLGLQLVSASGKCKTLVDGYDGQRFKFLNNAAVGDDGTVYFTDTSTRWGLDEYVNELLEGQPTGRLFARSPSGELEQLAGDLQFANGVALAPDGKSLFLAETGRYRVHRHWLAGPRQGHNEVFFDNLPGFPDNLTLSEGMLWVSLVSPRQKMVDFMMPRNWMRHLTYRLPEALKPKPVRHGIVLGIDMQGKLVHNLQDTSGKVAMTSGARYFEGKLYIGSLSEPRIAILDMP